MYFQLQNKQHELEELIKTLNKSIQNISIKYYNY